MKLVKRWLIGVGIAAIIVPILVHMAFKIDAPCPILVSSWTSGDVLAYVGSLLGAVATIVAVILTIKKSDEDRQTDLHLSVLPCVTMQDLRRINRMSFMDFVLEGNAPQVDKAVPHREAYAEVKVEKDYAVYSPDGFLYHCELTDEQRKKVEQRMLLDKGPNGVMLGVMNPSAYVPLVFSNVGNGPAVNCCISVVKADTIKKVNLKNLTTGSIKQMTVGSERYLGIYFDDCTIPDCFGEYQIVVMYEDIYGTKYVQDFMLKIGDEDSGESSSLSMAISRHKRRGDCLVD